MRATIIRCAIVAVVILATTGCKSSGWTWGRKNAATPSANSPMSGGGPVLPSASASAPAYGSTAGTAGAYNPNAGNPYAGNPYVGQPAGYSNGNASAPATDPAAGGGNYANTGAPPTGATAGGPMAPQAGPYNESYGQPAGAAPYGATAGSPTGPPGVNPSGYGQASGSPPASQSYPSTDAYSTTAPPATGGYAAGNAQPPASDAYSSSPSDPGAAAAQPTDQYASDRYAGDRYGSSVQPEQAAADRYAAANQAAGDPAAGAPPAADRYQPGNTGYQPGNTGYAPPGVPQYQTPGQPSVPQTARRDPYYRPGGTGDYSQTARTASSTAADRYGNPGANAAPPADPYAAPQGGQTPYQGPASMSRY